LATKLVCTSLYPSPIKEQTERHICIDSLVMVELLASAIG